MSKELLYRFKSKSTSLFQQKHCKYPLHSQSPQLRYLYLTPQQQQAKHMGSHYDVKAKKLFKRQGKKLQEKVETIDRWKQKYCSISNSQQRLHDFHRDKKLPAIKSNRHLSRQIVHNEKQKDVLKEFGISKARISQTIQATKNKKSLALCRTTQRPLKKLIEKSISHEEKLSLQIKHQRDYNLKFQQQKTKEEQTFKKKTNLILSRILEGNPQRWEITNQQQNQFDQM